MSVFMRAIQLAVAASTSYAWAFSCAAGMNVTELNVTLHGKTVLITGSDGRLGFPLSLAAVRAGAMLIAGSRTQSKADANKIKLESEFGVQGSVDTMVADLSSFASVRAGAASVLSKHPVIDVIVHMAGIGGFDKVTADGYDGTTQINHLSSALLTDLFLPALSKSPSPRVVYIGSSNMFDKVEDWETGETVVAQTEKWIRGVPPTSQANNTVMFYYSLSKLLVGNYAAEQALRHPELTVFSVNPGWGRTDAWNHSKYADACSGWFRPCPQYPVQAVTSSLFAAAQPGIEMASGSLIDFETHYVDTPDEFTQSGESCVPRPLPSFEINAHRAEWFDAVQTMIGNQAVFA